MIKVFNVTNDQIALALESFGLPIYYGEVPEDKSNEYNFFYFRESNLEGGNTRYLTQNVDIYYVSTNQDSLKEAEIIGKLESIGLSFNNAAYERLKIEETNNFIDVVEFNVGRIMKKVKCSG